MKKYRYVITLMVEVEAFDQTDAWEAINDTFGPGATESGIEVTDLEWEFKN